MRTKAALIAFIAILALIPFGAAAEADANLRAFSSEACPTGSAKYAVDITNPGNAQDTYTVSVNEEWSTVAPSTVEVAGGETETAYIWLQPPASMEPGSYSFQVEVDSSNTGETEILTGTLDVLSCRDVELSVDNPSQTVCRGETATYNVQVMNNGRATETYDLSTDADVVLSDDQVTLEPGESTTVQLAASGSSAGTADITVHAESTTSFASDSTTVEFTAEQCKSVDLFLTPSENTVCEGEPAEFRATVQNTGSVEDSYSLSTNVEGATVPDITLEPGESETFRINVQGDAGTNTVVARVQSQTFSEVTRSEDATLQSENCYDLIVGAPDTNTIQIDRENRTLLEFALYNNGTRSNTYDLDFDGPEWADLRPQDTELRPGEQSPVFVYVAPDFFAEDGTYTSKVAITGDGDINRVLDIGITVGNETITADPEGQDTNQTDTITPAGQLISRASGLASIILVMAVLFLGGYYLFQKRWSVADEEGDAEDADANDDDDDTDTVSEVKEAVTGATTGTATRDYYKSANDFLDRNRNTVTKSLREDNYSERFLEVLLEEERQDKHRESVVAEIQRQLDQKRGNGQ